jgi:hypothetical protein
MQLLQSHVHDFFCSLEVIHLHVCSLFRMLSRIEGTFTDRTG